VCTHKSARRDPVIVGQTVRLTCRWRRPGEYAEEALQWSRHSETEEEKKALLAKLCGASASQRV
jgi:hypothetical protein